MDAIRFAAVTARNDLREARDAALRYANEGQPAKSAAAWRRAAEANDRRYAALDARLAQRRS